MLRPAEARVSTGELSKTESRSRWRKGGKKEEKKRDEEGDALDHMQMRAQMRGAHGKSGFLVGQWDRREGTFRDSVICIVDWPGDLKYSANTPFLNDFLVQGSSVDFREFVDP